MGSTSTTICTAAESTDLVPFWQSLERQSCAPMQQYIWSRACWEALPIGGDPHLVVVRTGPQSGGIAPLVKLRTGLHRLEQLGVTHLFEPSDFLYSDVNAVQALATALARSGSVLSLGRVPTDTPTVAALQQAYRGRGTVLVRPAEPFPRIVLGDVWREPEGQLNAGRRSDLRRAMRNAEKLGPVRHEVLTPAPGELAPLLEEAFEVEAANWKGREGTALARDQLRGAFFRRYAAAASASGSLRLCFLRVGETAVAMQLAVESCGAFWLLKIGYREEFSRCSPGMLLIAVTIRYAAERGLSSYEFLGTAESWTRIWTQDERASASVRAYPLGVRGLAALSADAFASGARRLRGLGAGRR
jgi:CelD/BcsL family acetyltransferase involved in cellulose biosynthesis